MEGIFVVRFWDRDGGKVRGRVFEAVLLGFIVFFWEGSCRFGGKVEFFVDSLILYTVGS